MIVIEPDQRLSDCSFLFPHSVAGNCSTCLRPSELLIRPPLPWRYFLYKLFFSVVLIGGLLAAPAHAQSTAPPVLTVEAPNYRVIDWTPWHERLSQFLWPVTNEVYRNAGYPTGYAKVSLTFGPDRRVFVSVVETGESGNRQFKKLAQRIYGSLDRNPILDYPEGSKRGSFSYCAYTNCTGAGPTFTHFRTDDREIVKE